MNKENNDNQPRRGAGDLQSVAKSIMPLARSILGKKGFVEVDILTDWSGIVGEELAAYTLPPAENRLQTQSEKQRHFAPDGAQRRLCSGNSAP